MSERKTGDRVLAEAVVSDVAPFAIRIVGDSRGDQWPGTGNIHDHPGVPVADLVEELELLHRVFSHEILGTPMKTSQWHIERRRIEKLRAAREAANKPPAEEETFDPMRYSPKQRIRIAVACLTADRDVEKLMPGRTEEP